MFSLVLSIIGALLVILLFRDVGESRSQIVWAYVSFILGPILLITSIIFGILGFKSKEKGRLKYAGIITTILVIIGLAIVIALFTIGF
ncbi:UNVERIFIED_ORG: putative membrane protein [Peribacillus simplex]